MTARFLETDAIEERQPVPHVAWVASLDTGLNVWSGDTNITLEGVVYQPGIGIQLSDITEEEGVPATRARVAFNVTEPQLRIEFLQDPGPVRVNVRWIVSHDRGLNWFFLPLRFVGRLSRPNARDGVYSVELERYVGTTDRGVPLRWSHEQQERRTGNSDDGLIFVRSLAQGEGSAVAAMTPSGIMSNYVSSPWVWGPESCNCLQLMSDLIGEFAPHPERDPYLEWMEMTEAQAIREGIRRFGSLGAGHAGYLEQVGMEPVGDAPRGGDMLIVSGVTSIPGHDSWDASGGRELVIFRSDDMALWYFGRDGLKIVSSHGSIVHEFGFPCFREAC